MSMTGRHSARYVGVALILLLISLLAGCTPGNPLSTFDTVGPVSRSQLVLFYWIFWVAVFVFVTVVGALLYIVIRYRRKPGDGDPPQWNQKSDESHVWADLIQAEHKQSKGEVGSFVVVPYG